MRGAAGGATALLTGLAVAAVTSGGLVGERIAAGDPRIGALVNAAMTTAAVAALAWACRRGTAALPLQLLGAAMGVLVVHLALRLGWLPEARWMSERPAQLVNDATAVTALLLVVSACAHRLDASRLAAALVLVGAYRLTGHAWHLDAAPHGFVVPVQDLVVAQIVAAALALPIARPWMLARLPNR